MANSLFPLFKKPQLNISDLLERPFKLIKPLRPIKYKKTGLNIEFGSIFTDEESDLIFQQLEREIVYLQPEDASFVLYGIVCYPRRLQVKLIKKKYFF